MTLNLMKNQIEKLEEKQQKSSGFPIIVNPIIRDYENDIIYSLYPSSIESWFEKPPHGRFSINFNYDENLVTFRDNYSEWPRTFEFETIDHLISILSEQGYPEYRGYFSGDKLTNFDEIKKRNREFLKRMLGDDYEV